MLRMRWKILCLFKDGFCFSIKEAKERRLFLTDDTDNHRSKICDAANARMVVWVFIFDLVDKDID